MNKHPSHRFNIWTLAGNGSVLRDEPNSRQRSDNPPAVQDSSKHVRGSNAAYDDLERPTSFLTKPGDLAILESLYDYGPSIAVELRGTCATSNGRSIACKTKRISTDAVHCAYDAEFIGNPAKRCDDLQLGTPMHLDLDQIGAFGACWPRKIWKGLNSLSTTIARAC